jgi:hypothetical protein
MSPELLPIHNNISGIKRINGIVGTSTLFHIISFTNYLAVCVVNIDPIYGIPLRFRTQNLSYF